MSEVWSQPMYKRIIVAVGDCPEWDPPVAHAIALAASTEAELWLLRVLGVPFVASAPDMVAISTLPVMTGITVLRSCVSFESDSNLALFWPSFV